jgi:hypothetical protein
LPTTRNDRPAIRLPVLAGRRSAEGGLALQGFIYQGFIQRRRGRPRLAVAGTLDIVISSIFHSVASRSSAHEIISHDLVARLALKTAAREKMAW